MTQLDITLVADGPSDRALIRVIAWVVHQHANVDLNAQFAENLPPASGGLDRRVVRALELYPCDILVVHRDAENSDSVVRENEISLACRNVFNRFVPIIPIRMTEAWLLGDELAIRRAAENAGGTPRLDMPTRKQWETMADPKQRLHQLLQTASSLSKRRLKGKHIGRWVARTADLVDESWPRKFAQPDRWITCSLRR
jgi:hypothetical protein